MSSFSRAQLSLCCVLLVACMGSAVAQKKCSRIPTVSGVDQAPTAPWNWGKCTKALEFYPAHSQWCKFNSVGIWPAPPTKEAQQCLKFGRATIYRGPIYGSSAGHMAACKKPLRGSNDYAMVAVSTKYLKTYQGGWASDKGSCDKCMCIRLHGADSAFNPGLQRQPAQRHIGLTFMGKVGDRCSECPDDSIDILQDRPLTYAPFDPKRKDDNFHAPFVNAKDGLRGFADPSWMRGSQFSLENVGTWTADWQWVPCEQFNHNKCANLMKSMGYKTVSTPKMTPGVDSWSLRPLASARTNKAFQQVPYCRERGHPCDKEIP